MTATSFDGLTRAITRGQPGSSPVGILCGADPSDLQRGGARSLVAILRTSMARPLAGARKAHKQFDVGPTASVPALQRAPRTTFPSGSGVK